MSKFEKRLMFFAGWVTSILSAYVLVGWLTVNPGMVKLIPGSVSMAFNTALCFVMIGAWLILKPVFYSRSAAWPPTRLMTFLAFGIVVLPGLALIETFGNINLGIDWISLHRLVLDSNAVPGRMAPTTCLAIICIGCAFLCDSKRNIHVRKMAYIVFGALAFLIAAWGLVTYYVNLNWLYRLAEYNQMSLGAGFMICLIGAGQSGNDETQIDNSGEDVRLTRIAATIMIGMALACSLAGFIILKQAADDSLKQEMQQKTATSAATLDELLEQHVGLVGKLLSFPMLAHDLRTLPATPKDQASLDHISKSSSILESLGISGLQLQDMSGHVIYAYGDADVKSEPVLPITVQGQSASLQWRDGYVLRLENTIYDGPNAVGKAITQQRLKQMDKLIHQLRSDAETSDCGACVRDGDFFNCFASRFITHAIRAPMFDNSGKPAYPMAHALLGETGIIYANDLRGIPILAAYTPVGTTGIGFAYKIDTREIYAAVRSRLNILMLVLGLFVVVGTFILRARIQPLAARLVQSELRMRNVNKVLEEDADRLNKIIAVQNKVARSPLAIESSLQKIVDEVEILTRSSGAVVEMIDGDQLHYRAASGTFANYVGFRLNIEGSLSGHCIHSGQVIRCDDAELDSRTDKEACRKLHIRSMIVAPLLHEGFVIGVLKTASSRPNAFDGKGEQALQLLSGLIGAAISHQQDFEDKQQLLNKLTQLAQYDSLTHLPNRSLFLDRLHLSLLRAERNKKVVALFFLDLDGFKMVNDNYGHHIGDLLLKQFAGRLTQCVRKTDTVSRLAGDEFTIVLDELANPEHDAKIIAAKIIASMAQIFDLEGASVPATTSIGIALSTTGKKDIEAFIRAADEEMYKAKKLGKNQFSLRWV